MGDVPSDVPALSASGENRSAIPSDHDQELGREIDERDHQRPAVQAGAMDEPYHRDSAITPQPATTSHGRWILVKNAPAT